MIISNDSDKSISLPPNWKAPKYKFGQLTKSGIIIGMEFTPLGFEVTFGNEGEWSYWIVSDLNAEDSSAFLESEIELLPIDKAEALLNAEIEVYQNKLAALNHQLKLVKEQ